MFDRMKSLGERHRQPESSELEAEIARTCGVLSAATGRLVSVLATPR